MTRDYAKKSRPAPRRNRPKSQVPGWVWLFTGLVLGGFIVFLARLTDVNVPEQPQQTAPEPAPKVAEEPKPEKQDTPKPRFDFYKLLRESEVIVPATEPAESQANNGGEQQASIDEFILQVGSFRKSSEADSLRAQLLLLNLDAYTEQVTLNNNEVWHRVLVGPFSNQSRLASARSTLVSNDYHALVLKRKRDD
ncbi:SPOR domain-containing protein [Marinimicrobium locisalis]|uniref:SPOR domain-containing protein n=1 Tax=Marinimicrobium locisalis TaxID=546022 RepID=UPI00322221E4